MTSNRIKSSAGSVPAPAPEAKRPGSEKGAGSPVRSPSAFVSAAGPGTQVPDSLHRLIATASGIPNLARQMLLHTGAGAARVANAAHAKAVTLGNHVAFNRRQYRPDSRQGRDLILHEAMHAGQAQLTGPGVSRAGLEREARAPAASGRGLRARAPAGLALREDLDERLQQYEADEWQDDDDHLLLIALGEQWALLPGSGVLVRPSQASLEAGRAVRGRLADQGDLMGVPATGASGSRFIRIGTRRALQLDAGRGSGVTAAIYMDQVHGIMGRMGLTEVAQLRIIHIHRDHVSEIPAIAIEFSLGPQSIVIPQEFLTGTVRRDLQRAITALRGQGGAWAGWTPGSIGRNLSGSGDYTLTRTTHGEITVEYLSLNSAMRTLATESEVTSPQIDRASFITRVTRRSDQARVITLGDVRFRDLELFRTAMGPERFSEFFQGVTTLNGFSHHAGRLEAGDVAGLMSLLDVTLLRTGELRVVVQTDRGEHAQTRADTIELMRRLGIEVALSERARAEGEGSSGVTASRDRVTAHGSRASMPAPIDSPLTRAVTRLRSLHQARETLRAWRQVFEGRGMNVEQFVSEIDASMETLRSGIRSAAEAGARVRASGETTAGGARDYNAGTLGTAYQQRLAAIPAATPAETAIGAEGFEALAQYRRRSLEEAPRQVALEAALRDGTYSDNAFSYMLSQLEPAARQSILYGRRGGPRPRDVAFQRLRAEYIFRRSVLPDGHTVSLAGMPRGRAMGARGVGALLLFVEVANIAAEGHRAYQIGHNTSRRRHVAPFLRRLIWWNQMGVMPRVEAVDEGLISNDYFGSPETVLEGLRSDRWDGLWFPHSSDNPGLPDEQVLRLGVFLAQHIRNYDEFASYFIDNNPDAVRWVGEGDFAQRRWEMKVGHYDTEWENETMERWEEIPLLTRLMQTYVRSMIANTTEILALQGRGEAPGPDRPDPRLGGLVAADEILYRATPWRARFRSRQTTTTVHVRTHGRIVDTLEHEITWWSDNPLFYVYREQGNRYVVGGADYNTYAVLRNLTTQNTQLYIGGYYGHTWEETREVPLESGLVEIDKDLLEPVPVPTPAPTPVPGADAAPDPARAVVP